jgi:hypothetical protein
MPNLHQVHLVPSELFESLRADGYEVRRRDLGEKILTGGLDLEALPLRMIRICWRSSPNGYRWAAFASREKSRR